MIILTGAGGFIGSVVLGYLNKQGINDIVLFDDLPNPEQYKNLIDKEFNSIYLHTVDEVTKFSPDEIDCVVHLGANSNTLEQDWMSIYKTNVQSTRRWSKFCLTAGIPFIFASSAAVYGNSNRPLNQYAFSKQISENEITNGVILRLFNVYGPNEYHKGRMASTIMHWHDKIKNGADIPLFVGSDNYCRDFIYVEDVARIIYHFIQNYKPGVYDVGTGTSISFATLADELIKQMGKGNIKDVVMPDDLESQYQTYTKADIANLEQSGFDTGSLIPYTDGVRAYITYLDKKLYY
jgi:ADP-L-glycero-D-manno-heptose 6-epimerase